MPWASVELGLVDLCRFSVLNLKGKGVGVGGLGGETIGFDQSIMNFLKQKGTKHALVEKSVLFIQIDSYSKSKGSYEPGSLN